MFLMNPTAQLVRNQLEPWGWRAIFFWVNRSNNSASVHVWRCEKSIHHMDHYLLDVVSPPSWKKHIHSSHVFFLVVSITWFLLSTDTFGIMIISQITMVSVKFTRNHSIIFQSFMSLIPWNDHFSIVKTPWNQDVPRKIPWIPVFFDGEMVKVPRFLAREAISDTTRWSISLVEASKLG